MSRGRNSSRAIERVQYGEPGVREEHAWAGESHYAPDFRAHLRRVTVDRALCAHRFFIAETAAFDTVRGVVVERATFEAKNCSVRALPFRRIICPLVRGRVRGFAVDLDHDQNGALLAVESSRCGDISLHREFLLSGGLSARRPLCLTAICQLFYVSLYYNNIILKSWRLDMNLRGTITKTSSITNAISFLAVVVVNALANVLPLNGVTTGQLSDEIPNLFVPAGLSFSIWGLIYLLLAGYSFYAIREAWSSAGGVGAVTEGDAVLLRLNFVANILWIFAWQWRHVGIAMIFMLIILGTLIALELSIEKKLAPGRALVATSERGAPVAGRARRFFLSVPIRIYLGWISVATIANVTALLVKLGWNGWGIDPRVWTVIVIAAGLAVALGFSVGRRQIVAPLVVAWAYAGIVIKRTQIDPGTSQAVWIAALVSAIIIVISIVIAQRGRSAQRIQRA